MAISDGLFSNKYASIRYPQAGEGTVGLRKAQIGAIHAIASHFTVSKRPAIVIMPTGTGKTAVLMMCPFILQSNRVLIITPSKLVRNQIATGLSALQPLRNLGVIDANPNELRVLELKKEIQTMNAWAPISNYQAVVSTPQCVSPGIEGIYPSDPEFFDLVLIDEAHHTPADSWMAILNHYPNATKVLFTATPFRRDKKEIPGKIIFNYPISNAYEDGIFGKTEFYPVNVEPGNDAAIARECERIFRAEPPGTVHYIMVRTDSKKRANELSLIYQNNTRLRLHLVHSGLTAKTVEKTLTDLRNGNLDGIICVDMLGEGFDFPNLKIAAIHSPHKSLAATLQFIGRFTRTNAENITYAKFIAIPAEIEIERQYLYRSNAIWKELIIEMTETRVATEIQSRELIEGFELNEVNTSEDLKELSLGSIEPSFHIKIYSLNRGEFQSDREIDFSDFGLDITYRQENQDESVSVLILSDIRFPKWSKSSTLLNVGNHLVITYFDVESSLLFINSTIKKSIDFYEFILHAYCENAQGALLSDQELNSVLANISEAEFFNIGMRNRSHYGTNESYRIITGTTAHLSIDRRDAENYHRGHLFGKGVESGENVTIGLSSSSKVWSHKNGSIPLFLSWTKAIAHKIMEKMDGRTGTPIDDLPTSITLDVLPEKDIMAINWHETAFRDFIKVGFSIDGQENSIELTDLSLRINYSDSDWEHYKVEVSCNLFTLPIFFSYNYDQHFTSENEAISDRIIVYRTDTDRGIRFMDYLNAHPLIFYYDDFSMLYNSYQYLDAPREITPFSQENLDDSISWNVANVDIEDECTGPNSIHQYFLTRLSAEQLPFCYYDHGSGEIADFITAELVVDELLIKLYHCKGSSGAASGNRVEDIYEVIGQAIKSLSFTTSPRLIQKLTHRQQGKNLTGPCRDNVSVLHTFISNNRGVKISFQLILVQPGITKSGIADRIARLLAATNSVVRTTNNCKDIKVITSI